MSATPEQDRSRDCNQKVSYAPADASFDRFSRGMRPKPFRCNIYKKQGVGEVIRDFSLFGKRCNQWRHVYAVTNSFSSALPLRNHGRSRLCMYRGSVRFFASSFCNHSRASCRRFAVFRKLA
jgi:hypothetical protein